MAVLLRLANGQGQCDKRCYDAREERCHCQVCGGLMHGVGQQRAVTMRLKLLRMMDQEIQAGEARPYWVDGTKRRQQQSVILVERRINQSVIRRIRAPARVRAQVEAGQLPLWRGAEHPAPILPLARPKRRVRRG